MRRFFAFGRLTCFARLERTFIHLTVHTYPYPIPN